MRVATLGSFDVFHAGHVALLRRCRGLAGDGQVIVGLNTDSFIERYKGHKPTITYVDREAILDACRYVDAVVPNDQTDGTALDVIEAIEPDIIAVGWDWRGRNYLKQLGLTNVPTRIVYLPYTPGAAGPSSAIKARIAEGLS